MMSSLRKMLFSLFTQVAAIMLYPVIEKKCSLAGKPRDILHELVHYTTRTSSLLSEYQEKIRVVSRFPRYRTFLFFSNSAGLVRYLKKIKC